MDKPKFGQTRIILTLDQPLRALYPGHIIQIDRALDEVGPFGEVRLVKQRGKLRFIQKLESRCVEEDLVESR